MISGQAGAATEWAAARHDRYILLASNAVGHRRRIAHGIGLRLPELLTGGRIVSGEGAVQRRHKVKTARRYQE